MSFHNSNGSCDLIGCPICRDRLSYVSPISGSTMTDKDKRIAGGDKGDVCMNEWDFEFVFDSHDEFFGMTEQQWNYLHDCKVRVKFIPIEDEPMQTESEGD